MQLFFVLSGFVFYYVYKERISNREISSKDFFVARFSRLYPLHFVTLLFVTSLMLIGHVTVTPNAGNIMFVTNLYQFLFNVSLLHNIFGIGGINSPTWSLSIEIFAYFLFFVIAWNSKGKKFLFALPVVIGIILYNAKIDKVFILQQNYIRVLPGFFMGCLTYEVYKHCLRGILKTVSEIVCAFIVVVTIILAYISGVKYIGNNHIFYSLFLFPSLIITVLNTDFIRKFFEFKFFKWLGDLSFSIYLIHMGLLLSMHLVAWLAGIDASVFGSRKVFFGYIAVVLAVSHLSHYRFEMPLQKFIRDKYYAHSKKAT
ncbi:acyltransferase [Clostridia bacterium]|nr:acyltransferase [Clostridia bacterium]